MKPEKASTRPLQSVIHPNAFHPSQTHDKQHTHTSLTSLRLATTKPSKAASKALRIHMQRLLHHVPPIVTDHSLWFHQELGSRIRAAWRTHATTRRQACVVLRAASGDIRKRRRPDSTMILNWHLDDRQSVPVPVPESLLAPLVKFDHFHAMKFWCT